MSFYQQLPTFSVETQNGSTLYPLQSTAEKAYQKLVMQNVPVEFFRDGVLEKGTRVPTAFLENSVA
jgi:hypothetical protein